MDSGSRLRRDIIRVLSLLLLAGLLLSSDFVNPISTSPVPTTTHASGSVPTTITAANASRLVQAWNYTIGGTAQFSTAPTVADGIIYIGSVNHPINGSEIVTLYALDAASGNERWSYSTGGKMEITPVVTNGVVYIISGGSTNDSSNDSLNALDATTGTKLWSYSAGATRKFSTAPTVANGVVYISSEDVNYGSSNDSLNALDAKTGIRLWNYNLGVTRGLSTNPTVANGVVYISSVDNASSNGSLYALDARTGAKIWSYSTGVTTGFSPEPTVANGVVFISSVDENSASSNGSLYALDARTGAKLWSFRLWSYSAGATGGFSPEPTVANGVIYITGSISIGTGGTESLYALSATSSTKVWSYDMMGSGFTVGTSDVANGVIYIDSMSDGKLSALDAKSGTSLWNHFTGRSLETDITVTNKIVYAATLKTLYAFDTAIQVATPTAMSSPSHGITQPLAPSINKAPVFADIPGLHIQSTEGLQCPLSYGIGIPSPADDLVFTTGRLTYSKDEIQQIRNYLHEMLYGSESTTNAYTLTPPPTLHWVSGSAVCTLDLEISNTGNSTVQISSLGMQLTSTPQPNRAQSLHTIDTCSVAAQQDGDYFCHSGSGGGGCGMYLMKIALNAAPASYIFAATPNGSDAEAGCPESILHPNDTVVFEIHLSSPGTKPGSVAPYLYALVPVLTVTSADGPHTFTLSSMAGIAAFVEQQQITCYGLLHDQDTTFVPIIAFPQSDTFKCLA